MSNLYVYFAATTDGAAAAVADSTDGPVADEHPVVEGVDPVVQGATLLSLINGRPYDEITSDPAWARLVSSPDALDAWVVSLPDGFTAALADSSELELTRVAGPWSETEEFWGAVAAEDLIPMLQELRKLAVGVRGTDAALYCWISL